MDRLLIRFFVLVAMAVGAAHYAPEFVSAGFFYMVLFLYFRSKDEEPFWLAFFLIMQDGILGYFRNFENVVPLVPGLPAVEATQLYILLTLVKAFRNGGGFRPFYSQYLIVILVYIIFLVLQGYTWGLSKEMNVQFRVIKHILPLFLFYSLPKLLYTEGHYQQILKYLFPVAFTILIAQVFTIVNGVSPAEYFGVEMETNHLFAVSEEMTYRGFYNEEVLQITFFGAFLYLSSRPNPFSSNYLYLIILSNFLSVYLSATRGWVIAFSFVAVLFVLFIAQIRPTQILKISIFAVLLISVLYSFPIIKIQVDNAFNRMLTLEALAEGDISADGTLIRLKERGPKVMKRWRQSPLTGIGFSDDFFDYGDSHVGNQNILLHSGIVGGLLLFGFLIYFNATIFFKSISLPPKHPQKQALLMFVIFFMGWFIIHSTSAQQFSYYVNPARGIIMAVFFSYAALMYKIAGADKVKRAEDTPLEINVSERGTT